MREELRGGRAKQWEEGEKSDRLFQNGGANEGLTVKLGFKSWSKSEHLEESDNREGKVTFPGVLSADSDPGRGNGGDAAPLCSHPAPPCQGNFFRKKLWARWKNNPKNQVASEHGGDEFKTWPVKAGAWVEQSHVSRFYNYHVLFGWIVTPHVIIPQYHPLVNKLRDFFATNWAVSGLWKPNNDCKTSFQGKIWPAPKEQKSVEEFLVLRSNSFRFQVYSPFICGYVCESFWFGDTAHFQLILNPLPWPHFPIIYRLLNIPKTKKEMKTQHSTLFSILDVKLSGIVLRSRKQKLPLKVFFRCDSISQHFSLFWVNIFDKKLYGNFIGGRGSPVWYPKRFNSKFEFQQKMFLSLDTRPSFVKLVGSFF